MTEQLTEVADFNAVLRRTRDEQRAAVDAHVFGVLVDDNDEDQSAAEGDAA